MIRKGRSGKEKKKFAHFGSPDGDAVMELIAFLIGACGLTLLILYIDGIRLNRWPVLLAAPIPAALVWFLGKAGGLNRRIWIAAGAALLAVLLSIPRIFPPLQEQFQAILSAVLGGGEGEEVTAAAALLAMASSLVLFLLKVGLRLRWPLYVFLSILLLASSSLGISPGTAAACLLFLCSAAAARRLGTGIDRLFWGDVAHEWAGAVMFALFIVHHILNGNWYRNLFRGKYSPSRIFLLIVDFLVLLSMIGLMVSGIMLSNHVFAFLGIRSGMSFARLLHMVASYWGFVLMSLHLGIHWGIFLGITKRALKLEKSSSKGKVLLPVIGAAVAVYGLTAFIRRDLLTYMLLRTQFVFLDFSEPVPLFYLDYLAMMGTFIFLAYYASVFLRKLYTKTK